ncbi:MAG: tRNA uridine-5-carboxymethylaminomethyl(34) synthesis GTPase MnmE [Gemmatimonadota bacterium]|nr:tRNA uridine-5-carboxymethylaminomethyl(34) synthesis GTPase MnmE [Gemmatimonadota bacterium]
MTGDALRFDKTIVAVATPPGRGAIAVVRLSGPDAMQIAARLVRPWPLRPRVAAHCGIFDGDEPLDDAVVTAFPAPNSYTGEDVVELSIHGGYAVPASVVSALIRSGATPALAGEFTRRAMMNGKIDLIQAEGIGELINARSSAMRRAALHQLHGGLSRMLAKLRDDILRLEALIAYDIDFPDEDDGPVAEFDVTRGIQQIEEALVGLLSTASFGRVIRDGAMVVIAGPPNAGKSSLFNAMLGTARAIVTEIPGTTRDALEAVIDTGAWPLRLVDTAGIRPTADAVEKLGIEASESFLARADVALVCAETRESLGQVSAAVSRLTDAPVLEIWTKADLRDPDREAPGGAGPISVSADERSGLETLFDRISEVLARNYGTHAAEESVLTTARQHAAISLALDELACFREARGAGEIPTTVAAVHLRAATGALEDLIGAVNVEDVLTKLFGTFCIGK